MDRYIRRGLTLALGLGVGVGLMMGAAAMALMPDPQPTEEEIRQRARELGMVDLTEMPPERKPAEPEPEPEPVAREPEPAPEPERVVSFVVTPQMPFQDFAALLKANGFLDDEAAFLARVAERGVQDRLQIGVHTLTLGEEPLTADEIIDAITTP